VIVDRVRAALFAMRAGQRIPNALVVAGGVAVNRAIRGALQELSEEIGVPLVLPPPELCTDNGAMIAWAGAERLARGLTDGFDTSPRARWPLEPAPARGKGAARA
jgi:N6-L-threonylcarbamoyladenine synthase